MCHNHKICRKFTFSFQNNLISQQVNAKEIEDGSNHNENVGKLTDRLLHQGLLTKKMINELQKEWESKAPKNERKLKNNSSNFEDDRMK